MERELQADDFIVSKTDLKGRITYVNKIFMDLAEYSEEELLGKPHSMVRHEAMPKLIFQLLWERVQAKEEIFAYVVNKTKNGNSYWVFANVTPSLDERGNLVGYYSVRRKPKSGSVETIKPIYQELLQAEKSGGVSASKELLDNLLQAKGVSYDEFVISLQK